MNGPAAATALAPQLLGFDLIRTLVSYDTTSRESNLALIHWVRDYLAGHGIGSQLTFDDERRKANLFATLPAQDGNVTVGGIVLSGHTDVVPVDGQPWDTPPFDATLVGDRLHGRGVTDMKSFSAIGLAMVPELLRRGLARPLHFALSYDEEVGCIGVRRLLADVAARASSLRAASSASRPACRWWSRTRASAAYRCRVRGHEAHSSLTPLGVNAVQVACEIVNFLTQMARRFRERGGFDAAYDVPYTTVHVGVIRGGTALNIVPRDCRFDFEFRHLPFDDPDALFAEVRRFAATLQPEMHAVDAHTHIEFDHLSALPGFDTHGGSEIASLGRACSLSQERGKVSFGSEAAHFHTQRHPGDHLRPGTHRPGAPAQRVGHARTALALRGVHASPRRLRLRRLTPRRPSAAAQTLPPMALAAPPSPPAIEIAFPGLARCADGNAGIPYAWTFAARRPGPHVLVQALTHGNEVCGAIALDWLLRQNVRPRCGTLSLVFANVAAYERFDASDPFASRCVDEDFNRLWSAAVLDGPRDSAELRRARELRAAL